jgi:hypothetical protein
MTELERIETAVDKTTDFQKRYNITSKGFAYILGKNLTLFVCMLIPFILVGFVWTDFGPVAIGPKILSDGLLTVALFVVGEIMMTKLGADGGRLDAEYIKAKGEYDDLVVKVGDVGSLLMGAFCDWQIEIEMQQAVNTRLRILRMTPAMWAEVKDLPYDVWKQRYGREKARKLLEIRNLKPIELNEAILLYDGDRSARGGVPVSAEEYLKDKKHFVNTLIACIFTGLLTVTVVVTLTQDITFARVLYTMFKLIMLLFRMAKGYDRGARAYNTVDVKQYRARSNYLRQYITFIRDKIYLNIEDKYGDIESFVGYTTTTNEE